jgi:uncharacterized membrane protein
MENKNVGWLILGMSVVIIAVIFLFNSALRQIINTNCSMAGHESCTMYDTLNQQTYLALAIVGVLVLVGLVLLFSKPSERIIVKKVAEKKKKIIRDTSDLRSEEKKVLSLVESEGTIFQADLIEKSGFGKVKVSRILDKLENRGFVERKRRGMTNVVVMKED